jgi:nucleosome binding factor SPN SPT16 subunit
LRVKILTDSNSVDQVSLEKYNFLRAEGMLSPQKQEILDLTDKQPKEETEANTTPQEPVITEAKSPQQLRREARQLRREARQKRREERQQ